MEGSVLSTLTAGWSEKLVYVAIALVTLVGVLRCIYPVLRNASLLSRAVGKLERSAGRGDKPIWRESRFLGRALRGDWQRFLLNAGQLDLRGMPCNTQDYINEDTVIYKPGHAQLAELIPSLLTSLGILGTFIGLMEGLSGLDLADASKTIGSIPSLLSGMRFAFATSVAGIACSLCFNIINRMSVGRAFKALDSFEDAFYELAMPRPLDSDVQLICQKQDDEANLHGIADELGNRLAASMEMSVGRALHPVSVALENLIQGIASEQVEGVRRIVGQFVQQMNRSLAGQFETLAGTMQNLNDSQRVTQEQMRQTMVTSQALAEDARRIQRASHDIAETMERENADVQADTSQALAELLSGIARQQAQLAQDMQQITAAVQSMAETQQAGTERVAGQTIELTDAMTRMRAAVDDMTSMMDSRKKRRGLLKTLQQTPEESSGETLGV